MGPVIGTVMSFFAGSKLGLPVLTIAPLGPSTATPVKAGFTSSEKLMWMALGAFTVASLAGSVFRAWAWAQGQAGERPCQER